MLVLVIRSGNLQFKIYIMVAHETLTSAGSGCLSGVSQGESLVRETSKALLLYIEVFHHQLPPYTNCSAAWMNKVSL